MPYKNKEDKAAQMRRYRQHQRNKLTLAKILKEHYPCFFKFLKQEYNVRSN